MAEMIKEQQSPVWLETIWGGNEEMRPQKYSREKYRSRRALQAIGFFSEWNEGPMEGSEERSDNDLTSFRK